MASDLRERGLRNPRHTFGVQHSSDKLFPLFVAPLRPMETLIGLRMRARSMLNRMTVQCVTPPSEVEYCAWIVPVRTIGEFFTDMFTMDPEDRDNMETGATNAGYPRVASLPMNTQGHQSRTPLQNRDRLWAGENGQADADVAVDFRLSYAPYVSHAIWHIARSWYETEINEVQAVDGRALGPVAATVGSGTPNLYQEPPVIGRLVRSPTTSGIAFGSGVDSPSAVSNAELAMRLSVLDNPNRTWAEFLKAQGVHPSRIDGLPQPVVMQKRLVQPWGTSHPLYGVGPRGMTLPVLSSDQRSGWYVGEPPNLANPGASSGGMFGQFQGVGLMGTTMDVTRGRRIMIDEPSLLVGTLLWRAFDFDQHSGANQFDAIHMINAGTWGVDGLGSGVDERDFIVAKTLERSGEDVRGFPEGTTTTFVNDLGSGNPNIINMLNLFLNGDNYCNAPGEIAHHRRPLSTHIPGTDEIYGTTNHDLFDPHNTRLVTYGDVRFGVATDLVRR